MSDHTSVHNTHAEEIVDWRAFDPCDRAGCSYFAACSSGGDDGGGGAPPSSNPPTRWPANQFA